MSPTFAQLATKYERGFRNIDAADFEGMDLADRLRLMEDVNGTDVMHFDLADCLGRADHPPEDPKKKKKKGKRDLPARTFRYTMSTENPVGPFGDVVVVKGWDFRDFKLRGQPFLFGHNIEQDRHPLGKMSGLLKGAEEDFVRGQPVLAGNSTFSDEGLNPFNDLTHDMVAAGFMPGSSVGFRINKSRQPTDEEMSENALLKKWSFIAEKTSLIEFSAVPVGMDPDAVKRRGINDQDSPLERALLAAVQEGRYDAELVAEFRERALGAPEAKGRSQVAYSNGPWPFEATDCKYPEDGVAILERVGEECFVPLGGDRTIPATFNFPSTTGVTLDLTVEKFTSGEPVDPLDDLTRALAGEDTEQGADSLDTDTTNDDADAAQQQRSADTPGEPEVESAPAPLRLTDVVRALDAIGLQDCTEDLMRAMASFSGAPAIDPEELGMNGPVTLAEFREENQSLRALTERLEERIAHLEDALLPESAESGAATGSRNDAGDDGDSTGIESLYANLFAGVEA